MDKEEPNVNTWGEISDSQLVLEAAKVEQKIRKTTRKTSLHAVRGGRLRRKLKINVIVKNKSTTIFHGLRSYSP